MYTKGCNSREPYIDENEIDKSNLIFYGSVQKVLEHQMMKCPTRYCTATTLPDGTTVLNGGRSRRGKPRGPPGSRELQTALKGCDDPLFLDFIRRCLEWDPQARMTPNSALR